MTFAEFQRTLSDGSVPPVLLFHGDEPFLARLGVSLLRKQMLAPGSEAFDFVSLAGRETSAEAIVAHAATAPMISGHRLTVVYDFEQMNPSQRGKLVEYLASPADDSCLALVSFSRLPGKSKFERQILSVAAVVDCVRPSADVLETLVRKMAEERGMAIDDDGLAVLTDWTDGSLNRIGNELDKLACFGGEDGDIGASDVEAVVGAKAAGVRELGLAVAERDAGLALSCFQELVDAGVDEAQLVSQLYALWIGLWAQRVGGKRGYVSGRARHILSGVDDIGRLAASRTSREYAGGVDAFYRADTGIRRGLEPRSTVGLLIYELAKGQRL